MDLRNEIVFTYAQGYLTALEDTGVDESKLLELTITAVKKVYDTPVYRSALLKTIESLNIIFNKQ